ncbi:MAG: cupin domain-containing protein [Pirellulaceae bacterium]|nr:cupin domain-containing protein [Pirellulaceae bacterium]
MKSIPSQALTIRLKSTGEQLSMWRTLDADGNPELQMVGCLPSQQPGPPMHIHFAEDESTEVIAGTMSVALDGQEFEVAKSESAFFPRGSVHRWWNDAHEDLEFRGVATPAVDLDAYLHALFDVINSAGAGKPSLFYLAHLMRRHRKTQVALEVPAAMQHLGFPLVVLAGTLLGKYRGTDWPGCPCRCTGASLIADGA